MIVLSWPTPHERFFSSLIFDTVVTRRSYQLGTPERGELLSPTSLPSVVCASSVWVQFRLDVLGAARAPVSSAARRTNATDDNGGEGRRVSRDGDGSSSSSGQHYDAMAEQRLRAYLEMRAAAERNRRQLLGEDGSSMQVGVDGMRRITTNFSAEFRTKRGVNHSFCSTGHEGGVSTFGG